MTINLNTPEYEGGCLWFPEYGPSLFRPQVGEAIIFSCSLLHEVTPVVFGKRYALLSFFYDDAAAQQRQQNQRYLAVAAQPNTASKAAKPSLGFSTATKKKRR
jgi:predicted 2-oxoglutarate/Fe(II)-dependent dioxygenase YbiX